ncbi:hypothetical protein [Laceyella putida]|uniref:Uncharacterized protein n=1 Tax=Laceyella putida TaxID=110101 RepID=A0ABW2RKF3_9BACL
MDYKKMILDSKNILSAIVLTYGKKGQVYADKVKEYQETKGKSFK